LRRPVMVISLLGAARLRANIGLKRVQKAERLCPVVAVATQGRARPGPRQHRGCETTRRRQRRSGDRLRTN